MADVRNPFIIRLGHRDLLGAALTVPQIRRLLAPVPLRLVADTIARVSSVLQNTANAESPAVQRSILDGLAPQLAAGVYARLDRSFERRGRGEAGATIMFEDIPLRVAFELALQNDEPDAPVAASEGHWRIVKAILACNDHLDDDALLPPKAVRFVAAGRERWAHYEFVTQMARFDDTSGDGMARSYDVLLRRYRASGRPGAGVLAAAIARRTSCDIDVFWALLFAFQVQQRALNVRSAPSSFSWLSVKSFSDGKEYAIPRAEVEGVLSVIARSDEEARRDARARYRRKLPSSYDNALLFAKPLLRLGDDVCAPVARMLYAKLSYGLHFSLQFLHRPDRREEYQRDVGALFEDYVRDLMRRIALVASLHVLTEAEMYAALGTRAQLPKMCDGLIHDGRRLCLWDAKTAYGGEGLFSGDLDVFREFYSRHIERVAEQFDSTLQLVRRGAFKSCGLSADAAVVGMLVVPWLPLPVGSHLASYVRTLSSAAFGDQDWSGLSIVRPSVLEGIEPCASAGANPLDLLAEYRDDHGPDFGLHNFLLGRPVPGYGRLRNEYLRACYAEAADRMRAVLNARRVGAVDGSASR